MQESVYDTLAHDTVAVVESLSAMLEKERTTYRRKDYLRKSTFITESDRAMLVDWCYSMVDHAKFDRETVAVAMEMVDRVMSTPCVLAWSALSDRGDFQLLAVAALYTTVKTNERVVLNSECFAAMSRGAYTVEEIEATERRLLDGLSWRLCAPTSVQVAHHILSLVYPRVSLEESAWACILNEICFQAECAVRDYQLAMQRPSTVAVAAIFNSLDGVDHASQRAILQALLLVMNEDFESPEDILAVRSRLLRVVEGNDELADDDTLASWDCFPDQGYCREIGTCDVSQRRMSLPPGTEIIR